MILKETTLGEVSSNIQTGPFGSQLHQSDYSEIGIPVVMPKDLLNGKICEDSIARVSEDHVNRLSRHKIEIGDILYSRRGDVGRCAYATKNETGWLCGTGCLRVTIDAQKADSKYVFYRLQMAETIGWVVNHAVGSTMLNLNTTILSEVPLKLPSLKEQKAVVSILSAYDDLIENNRKQIKLLEEAAQRLYKEWFVDLRFPGYENTPIIDGVPQGWRLDIVKSVVSLLSGYAFKSSDFVDNGKYSIVTIKNVQDGNFDGENVNTIAEIPSKMPSHCILNNGDILLSLTGNVGRICLVNGDKYLLNQRVAKLDSKYPAYAYCLFRIKDMFDIMSNLANGAAQQNLSPIRTENVRIFIPSDSLIQKFEDIVSPMIAKMLVLNKSNSNLKQARDRLLPKLMSGELEV